VLGALVLGLGVATAAPALAQTNRNAEARALFERGNRHYEQALRRRGARREALLSQAMEAYVQSLRIVRTRNVVYNAAVVLEELGRFDEAFAYYTEYLGFEDIAEDDRNRIAVVAVQSDPPGAEVRVGRRDLAPAGRTPLEVAVPPGEHRVFVSLDGYADAQLNATASTGQRVGLSARLEALPVPIIVRAPPTGTLTIDGQVIQPNTEIRVVPGQHVIRFEPATVRTIEIRPGEPQEIDLNVPPAAGVGMLAVVTGLANATVSVDGTVVGEGERVEVELNAGSRLVRVEAPGRAAAESSVDVPAGARVEAHVEMRAREEGTTLGPLPAIAWAATGAAAVITAVLGAQALSAKGEYDDARPPTRDQLTDVESANTRADVAMGIALGLGGVALLLTILNDDVEQAPSTITVAAAPLPGGGMVGASLPMGLP
jgi:tetratricopeptide (TPR) repeat protein